mgnify:CR=1 FL=1
MDLKLNGKRALICGGSSGLGRAVATALVAEGANLGLGCGNPQAIAALKPGETVIDLGSGAGFDCFLAARQVGPSGAVIGVDMTHEMLAKARAKDPNGGYPGDFPDLIARLAPQIKSQGIKLVTNAGGVNPRACKAAIEDKRKAKVAKKK